jgi:hypothetical protein
MATNKPVGDNTRKGAVKKRSQLATKTMGKKTFTKRNKEGGQFMRQKKTTNSAATSAKCLHYGGRRHAPRLLEGILAVIPRDLPD